MGVQLTRKHDGRVLEVEATDKLTAEDYWRFVPEVEALIEKHGRISLLFEMRDFHGWEPRALWEDIKFDVKHLGDIDRLAMIGDKRWEAGMSDFCRPFTKAKIRYFDLKEAEQARQWVDGAETEPAGRTPPAAAPPQTH